MRNKNLRPRSLVGGPWDGNVSDIPKGGTLIFNLKGFHGFYKGNGEWVNVFKRGAITFMVFDEAEKLGCTNG